PRALPPFPTRRSSDLDEGAHRVAHQVMVAIPIGLEPLARVVAAELAQEGEGGRGEARPAVVGWWCGTSGHGHLIRASGAASHHITPDLTTTTPPPDPGLTRTGEMPIRVPSQPAGPL